MSKELSIYQVENSEIKLSVDLKEDTTWATQE